MRKIWNKWTPWSEPATSTLSTTFPDIGTLLFVFVAVLLLLYHQTARAKAIGSISACLRMWLDALRNFINHTDIDCVCIVAFRPPLLGYDSFASSCNVKSWQEWYWKNKW